MIDEFATSFNDADKLIVTDIYAAREKDTGEIHSSMLVEKINDIRGKITEAGDTQKEKAVYIKSFEDIASYLSENIAPGEIIITMGAGDVFKIGEMLIGQGRF